MKKILPKITAWVLALALMPMIAIPVSAAEVVTIDLDEITADPVNGIDYTVDKNDKLITVTTTDPVIIRGDGTEGGWRITINSATNITIENSTKIVNTLGGGAALDISGSTATIHGKGSDITITGVHGIMAQVDLLTITGTLGDITGEGDHTGLNGHGITTVGGSIMIEGTVGNISGYRNGIYTPSIGNITISGITGYISGGDSGINAQGSPLTISDGVIVRTSSVSANTKISDQSQGILFAGDNGTVYGDVTLIDNLTIESGQTLTISDGATLTVPSGVTLTNNGTINNQGEINNEGEINSRRSGITGSGNIAGISVNYPPLPSMPYTPPVYAVPPVAEDEAEKIAPGPVVADDTVMQMVERNGVLHVTLTAANTAALLDDDGVLTLDLTGHDNISLTVAEADGLEMLVIITDFGTFRPPVALMRGNAITLRRG